MRIIKLEAQNIKKLKAVEISPDGNIVQITGANEQGKSSVLDAIMYAFSGKAIEGKPIRDGEDRAEVIVDCGDFVIKRSITNKRSTLQITTKEGIKKSPQTFLDGIIGKISFDPLKFMKEKPLVQKEALSKMIPEATTLATLNTEIETLKETRLAIGRAGKKVKTWLEMATKHDKVPEKEVSVADVIDKLNEAREANKKIVDIERDVNGLTADIEASADIIRDLEEKLLVEAETLKSLHTKLDALLLKQAGMKKVDESFFTAQLKNSEEINRKVRENEQYNRALEAIGERTTEYHAATEKIDILTHEKERVLSEANFPIDGLSFSDEGVTFKGIPLQQISEAEKIKVGTAISMALNPEMRVLRIKDGSLLDSNSMLILAEMADKQDYQIWIERVDETGEIGIYIEEGEVKNGK